MRGISKNTVFALFGILGLLLTSGALLGSTYVVQQSVLYPYRSMVEIQEDFITSTTGSNSIGALGWTTIGGTTTAGTGIASRPGILTRDTTAVISTVAQLFLGGTVNPFLATENHSMIFAVRLNTNDANTTLRIGTTDLWNTNPPVNGIFFEKLDADTNWFCVSRAAGVQTRTDSGIAITTNFTTFAYSKNSSGIQFALNNANVCGLITTNLPTVAIRSGSHIINAAAAAKTYDTDYYQLRLTGLAR